MATSHPYLFLFTNFLLFHFSISASSPNNSKTLGLILGVSKDTSTLQYVAGIEQRTPLAKLNVVLDLSAPFLWVNCEQGYTSSTYRPVPCGTKLCALSKSITCLETCEPTGPGCSNHTCGTLPMGIRVGTSNVLAQDVLYLSTTYRPMPGPMATVQQYTFSCGSTVTLEGLAPGTEGMAGLSRAALAMPTQLTTAFHFSPKFMMCIPPLGFGGVVFFGDAPAYPFGSVSIDSTSLIYTPLLINPWRIPGSTEKGDKSDEYFIGVMSIKVNGKPVSLNTTLLSISKTGFGGTKISTIVPYTTLESSIYKAVAEAFVRESGLTMVKPVKPFKHCFASKNVGSTRVGPAGPQIDLVMSDGKAVWTIFGANSMVQVGKDTLCLALIDGGEGPTTTIVIGGYQLENNLLEFDLARNRLGFTSSLLFKQTNCNNFVWGA